MKLFIGTLMYGRCQFDVRFCARSIKDAAKILDKTVYYINITFSVMDCKEPFKNIMVKPYNHIAKEILGNSGEITYKNACIKIDNYYSLKQ